MDIGYGTLKTDFNFSDKKYLQTYLKRLRTTKKKLLHGVVELRSSLDLKDNGDVNQKNQWQLVREDVPLTNVQENFLIGQ